MRSRRLLKNQQGFTLIEIIAVLILLGILAAVAVPKYMSMQVEAQQSAVDGALAAAAGNLSMSYSRYLVVNSSTPTNADGTITQWTGGTAIDIPANLGDFSAAYKLTSTAATTSHPKTLSVLITLSSSLPWFSGSAATKTKTIVIQ